MGENVKELRIEWNRRDGTGEAELERILRKLAKGGKT